MCSPAEFAHGLEDDVRCPLRFQRRIGGVCGGSYRIPAAGGCQMYVGQIVGVGLTTEARPVLAYRVSNWSFPNRVNRAS